MRPLTRSLALLGAMLSLGCSLLGGVQVETVDVSVQKPSNVALYVEVTDGDEPVTNLEPKHFKVYENGELLSPRQIGRTLLPAETVTDQEVLLLMDLSNDPAPDQRELHARSAEAFVRKLVPSVPVRVRAYDGGPTLLTVADFPRGSTRVAVPELTRIKSRDASRNLNGAITLGLAALDGRKSGKPIKLGTLVVFARGPDLAGRVSDEALSDALHSTKSEVLGIVIGPDTNELDFLPGSVVHAQDGDALPIAFEEAGSRVAALHAKYYLVAYCSPARAGQRSVRVEVVYTDIEGKEKSGSTAYELDANGFSAGCKPESLPRFEHPPEPQKGDAPKKGDAPAEPEPGVVAPPPGGDYAK